MKSFGFYFFFSFLLLGFWVGSIQPSKTLPDTARLKEDELINYDNAWATLDFVGRSTTDNFIVVPLERTTDGRFNVYVAVGTPVQSIMLFIDTTISALMFFNSTECTLQWKCFDTTRSSSFRYCTNTSPSCPQKSYCRMGNDFLYFNISAVAITDHFPVCISVMSPFLFVNTYMHASNNSSISTTIQAIFVLIQTWEGCWGSPTMQVRFRFTSFLN